MSTSRIIIAPSLLSADFTRLGEELKAIEAAGADWLHIDVMDGHFVPNITMGPLIVKAAKKVTSLPLDVHLMISDPDRYVEDFHKAGADILTVQVEACTHLHRVLSHIRELGMKAGVALNPATCLDTVRYVLPEMDILMIMTVNPGFGGQEFISSIVPKISEAKEMIREAGLPILIEVDGGVSPKTAPKLIAQGADALVSGSAVFGNPPYADIIAKLRG
jgi:ribulose-phosphate 3-epimerase